MAQQSEALPEKESKIRKEVFNDVLGAFSESYHFIGEQVARECLLSIATWNIERYSNPDLRYRSHLMLRWDPGWLKSTLLRQFKEILGEEYVSTCGKMTSAVLRGSVSNGTFSPPVVLKSPIVVSTEFGQTEWEKELRHTFLALLDEGETNVSLNKFAGMSDALKHDVMEKYHGEIHFDEENSFNLKTDFVFWGATHDPQLMQDSALKDRMNIITPEKELNGAVTERIDKSPSIKSTLSKSTVKELRRVIDSSQKVETDYGIPSSLYREFNPSPRLTRDVKARMAARNWWGLESSPRTMREYMDHLVKSRRVASMNKYERVKDILFENPMTWDEVLEETRMDEVELHHVMEKINIDPALTSGGKKKCVVRNKFNANNTEEKADNEKEQAKESFFQ